MITSHNRNSNAKIRNIMKCLEFFAKNIHQQRALLIFLYLNFHSMFQPKTGSSSGELLI